MKKIIMCITCFFLSLNIVNASKISVKLDKCIDGDTARFIYNNKSIKARMLAINTPEVDNNEEYSLEAKEYTCNRLKQAHKITLEYDSNSDKTDKYDRHLVWVWIDDSLLQKELVSVGYAKVDYLYNDYKYTEEIQRAQDEAKINKIGLWNKDEKSIASNNNFSNGKNESEGYEQLINNLFYTRDGKFNYAVIVIIILIIILSRKINQLVLKSRSKRSSKN